MLITEEYRATLKAKHAMGSFGIYGARHAQEVDWFCRTNGIASILDYGCGAGKLAEALPDDAPYDVREYDPAIEGKDGRPDPADLIVCTDVLEHIEPACIDAVLSDIHGLMVRVGFFLVHTSKAKKTLPDGRNAHLIIRCPAWWLDKLEGLFLIDRMRWGDNELKLQVRKA